MVIEREVVMNDFRKGGSRFDERIQKRKHNRILNLLIALVSVFIVVVGWNILFADSSEQASHSSPDSSTKSNTAENSEDPQNEEGAAVSDPQDDETNNDDRSSGTDDETTDDEQQANENDDQENNGDKSKKEDESNKTDEEIMNGSWEAIGTQQEGSFEPNFQKDPPSRNWIEMKKAIFVPTGFSEKEITLWRLENGGGPQKAVGKYSLKENPDKLYVVHIQWVDGKGWKPVNVEIKSNSYN
jgi:hypothetical protein